MFKDKVIKLDLRGSFLYKGFVIGMLGDSKNPPDVEEFFDHLCSCLDNYISGKTDKLLLEGMIILEYPDREKETIL